MCVFVSVCILVCYRRVFWYKEDKARLSLHSLFVSLQEFFEDGFVKKSVLEKGVFVLKAAVRLYRQTTEGLVADFMKNYAATYGEEQAPFEVLLLAFVALTFTLCCFCCFMSCNKATTNVGDESCGQVALDVSATSHPGSGERGSYPRWVGEA